MPQRRYKAVFFDLDGTLLPIDMDAFIQRYFVDVRSFAAERGFEPEGFLQALLAGTKAMTVEGEGFNADRFWSVFRSRVPGDAEALQSLLDEYYDTRFDALGEGIVAVPEAGRVVSELKRKGYPLYLTTMPLFPRVAVERRLEWAGVPAEAFDRITTYDNSTSTKPHLAYFRENVEAIGLDAADILMVGNNTREDLAALDVGMDAYLVTDWLLDPIGFDLDSVKHGTIADLERFVSALPECE